MTPSQTAEERGAAYRERAEAAQNSATQYRNPEIAEAYRRLSACWAELAQAVEQAERSKSRSAA